MTFVPRDLRQADARMPVAGVLSVGLGFWRTLEARGQDGVAMRVIAAALALLITWTVFAVLDIRIESEADPVATNAIETILLSPPRPKGARQADPLPSGGQSAPDSQSASPQASIVDVSTATPVSVPEWSVSRIRVVLPRARSGTGTAQGATTGAGTGRGGSGVYDPYAGATPMRGTDEGASPRYAPEASALDRLMSLARRSGLLATRYRCDLLLAMTGTVLEASCRTAGGQVSSALSELVVGQHLYNAAPSIRRTSIELSQ